MWKLSEAPVFFDKTMKRIVSEWLLLILLPSQLGDLLHVELFTLCDLFQLRTSLPPNTMDTISLRFYFIIHVSPLRAEPFENSISVSAWPKIEMCVVTKRKTKMKGAWLLFQLTSCSTAFNLISARVLEWLANILAASKQAFFVLKYGTVYLRGAHPHCVGMAQLKNKK